MDNKLAVQRIFRGVLLRSPSSTEEKLFTQFFDNRTLSYEQLVILGWQSTDFLNKTLPITLLNYALSGIIDGQEIIGWYNSPSGTPLAPSGSDTVHNAFKIILSGYGLLPTDKSNNLSSAIHQAGFRLGFSLSSSDAENLAKQIIAGTLSLPDLMRSAINIAINERPKLITTLAGSLLESVLSENQVIPSGVDSPPIVIARTIADKLLAPSLKTAGGGQMVAYETSSNDGSLTSTPLELTGVSWRGKPGDTILTLSGLPAGLSGKVVIVDSQTAEVRFSGKATSHAASATKNITLTFADNHFLGTKAADISPLIKGATSLELQFFDNTPWTINEKKFVVSGSSQTLIDLEKTTGNVGSMAISTDSLANINDIDAHNILSQSTTLLGNANNNELRAGSAGSTLRGREGDDRLYGGNGVDTFVFESISAQGNNGITGNGLDTIHNFRVGEGGDILDFRSFLGTPSTASLTPISGTAAATPWSNGSILVIYENGSSLESASQVATLFGNALAAPSAAARAIVITGGIPGPNEAGSAHVWFISNRSSAGDINLIETAEVAEVAQLIGVNNITLNSLLADNFLI